LPDGIGLKFAAWLKGIHLNRFTGANTVNGLLNFAASRKMKVAILNRADGLSSNEAIRNAIYKKHPELTIFIDSVDKFNYHYQSSKLEKFRPDILFVALGAPEQDIIIPGLLKKIPSVRLAMGVGGTFDYLTKKLIRAPYLIQIIGFEWLWRLLIQPSRWKRIFQAFIIFPLTVIRWELRQFRYRPNVVAFILNHSDEVLILNSKGKGDYWGLPQGGRERGESIEATVRREVKEETGLSEISIEACFKNVYSYSWNKPYTHSGYKGQRQSLCIVRYTGPKDSVITNPFEHKAYRWVKISDLIYKSSPVHKKQYELFLSKYNESKDSLKKSF
jgi:N-acetylglucosaminyldiphosphoundecaprenol N-acetyl-beta-D-mannosaminyltransferase